MKKPGIGVIMYTADFFDSLLNCIKGTDKKMKKGGFLEGTKLTGYSEQKPKKKGKLLKKAADTDKAAAELQIGLKMRWVRF